MRIEQLQTFLAVVEIGNFGQAAKKCGVTQSTISRQIQSLEKDLGLALFHRTSQAKLTVGGEKLLPRAQRICQEWERATHDCAELIETQNIKYPIFVLPPIKPRVGSLWMNDVFMLTLLDTYRLY